MRLLADSFGVAFTPSGRKSPLPGSSPVVLLRIPIDLKYEIEAEARRSQSKPDRGVVRALMEVLNQHREVVMSVKATNLILARPAQPPPGSA